MTTTPADPAPIRPDPAKIIVPRKHAQILIEPPLDVLQAAMAERPDRGAGAMFAGQSVESLRAAARGHFLEAAIEWAMRTGAAAPPGSTGARRWLLTGHQVEFYHAGVWAKVIAADELAKRTGGVAFDVLVDHDTVDHLGFDVPSQHGALWKRTPVHWAEPSSVPADSIASPTSPEFERWDANLAEYPQSQTDSMAFMLAALRPASGELAARAGDYARWLSQARAKFERAMHLHVHHVPTSLVCSGETWWTFVRAWIENAEPWSKSYNTHLAAYRNRQGIKNPHHPMPDLAQSSAGGESVTFELPFWIYSAGEARQRLLVRKSPGKTVVLHGQNEHPLIEHFLTDNPLLAIRPRALTLTMYLRLFIGDLFIHGIGGALYDQITDGLLAELFHAAPPYACVSAAWLLPLGQPLEDSGDISFLKTQRHHLLHNPQQAIDPFTAAKTDVAELILERKTLLQQIRDSLRQSRRDKQAIGRRREWFRGVHAVNAALHLKAPHLLARMDRQLEELERAQEQNKVLLWREYFFGLHSMASLGQLIAKVRGNAPRPAAV